MSDLDSIKEQIRLRVDLVDIVSEHVQLKRGGRELRGLCPFHNEKTPSFFVNPDKGFFRCHGCNAGGDLFKFVQLREGVGFMDAIRLLADRAGIEMNVTERRDPNAPGKADLFQVNEWAVDFFRRQLTSAQLGEFARNYLKGRGIVPQVAEKFQLGLAIDDQTALQKAAKTRNISPNLLLAADLIRASDQSGYYDTFRHRLMFPIRDATKRCVGFGGRTLGDAPAKYLNTAQNAVFDKSHTLFGIDQARSVIGQSRRVILVEGYTDCLAAHQLGFADTVATLGTAATDAQMGMLRRYADELILLFDSDAAGEAAADRALAVALQHGLTVRIARVPSGKDPGDLLLTGSSADFTNLLNSAVEALAFKWRRTCARYEASPGGRGRREALMEFVDLVASAARFGAVDAIQRGLIANQVGKLLSLPPREILEMMARSAGRSSRTRERATPPNPPLVRGGLGSIPPLLRGGVGGSDDHVRPQSGEQAALRTVLEVIVNVPSLIDSVDEAFDPEDLEDPLMRRAGRRIWNECRRAGFEESTLISRLLASVEDAEEAQVITAFIDRGSRLTNPAEAITGAVDRLKRARSDRTANAGSERFRQNGEEGTALKTADETEAMTDDLAELSRTLLNRGGEVLGRFSPARIPTSWR